MPATDSALIVGAGPAGLSAAIALRQAGVERVEIVEATDGRGVIGSELTLAAPMLRALDTLSVADECATVGVGLTEAQMCTPSGEVFERIPFPPPHRPGLPGTVGISRPNLHAALTRGALAAGAHLRYETTVTGLQLASGSAEVSLSGGSVERYGLVVGADGVNSFMRSLVLPDATDPSYVGQMAWRARVPRGDLPGVLSVFYGERAKPGLVPVSEQDAYVFCLVTTEPEHVNRERFPELLREVLEPFGGPIAVLREQIHDPQAIHYSPLTPVLVKPPWNSGCALLIGDAVHATTPHLAYGAGLAVEDGVVLGDVIATHEDVEAALEAFTERRFERCQMIVQNGIQLSRWEQHPENPDADHAGVIGASHGALAAPI